MPRRNTQIPRQILAIAAGFALLTTLLSGTAAATATPTSLVEVQTITSWTGSSNGSLGSPMDSDGDLVVVGDPNARDSLQPNGLPIGGSGAVRVWERSAGAWSPVDPILPPQPRVNGLFGIAVGVSGPHVVVGERLAGTANQGAVHIFERLPNGWQLEATFFGDPTLNHEFGRAVAIDGATIVVGDADGRATSNSPATGTVTILEEVAEGVWEEGQRLATPGGDRFGVALELDGPTLAIGSEGRVTIYEHDTTWTPVASVVPSGSSSNGYGQYLDLRGSLLVSGDPLYDGAAGSNTGATFVHQRVGPSWTEAFRLEGHVAGEQVGRFVATNGVAVVTATRGDIGDPPRLDVLTAPGGSWTVSDLSLPSELTPPDFTTRIRSLRFGSDQLFVQENQHNGGYGALAVYDSSTFSTGPTLNLADGVSHQLGRFVDISGGTLIAWSRDPVASAPGFGVVEVFERTLDGTFAPTATLDSPGLSRTSGPAGTIFPGLTGELNRPIAVDGDRIAALGTEIGTNNQTVFSAVLIFERTAAGWEFITHVNTGLGGGEASSIDLRGDTIVVGRSRTTIHGNSVVIERSAATGAWAVTQGLSRQGPTPTIVDRHGTSVAISADGTRIAIGAPDAGLGTSLPDAGFGNGSVSLFRRAGAGWVTDGFIVGPTNAARFGHDLAFTTQGALVVGDDSAADPATGARQVGAVHVYERDANQDWQMVARFYGSTSGDQLGRSVDADDNLILVGVPETTFVTSEEFHVGPGRIHLLARTATGWETVDTATPSTASVFDQVGSAVAIDGDTAVAGASLAGSPAGIYSGAVHVFKATADIVPPSVEGIPDRPANSDDWYSEPVTIAWHVSDPTPSSGVALTPAPTVADLEGLNTYVSGDACDAAGNCSTGSLALAIDLSNPSISATSDPQPNAAGWSNQPVTVTFSCADDVSGIASCPEPTMVTADGAGQSVTGTAIDLAGRAATVTAAGIHIDQTPPLVSDVRISVNPKSVSESSTLTAQVADALSGIASVEYSIDGGAGLAMAISGTSASALFDGSLSSGVYQIDVRAQDVAGNWSAPSTVYLVVYDPAGASATGGGWIVPGGNSSDPGDALPGLDGSSKAHFGFSVRYQNGAQSVPGGHLQFRYQVGGLRLSSSGFDWLVVTNSNWARFQGLAEVDGISELLPFRVDARDGSNGQADRFIIKIWSSGADPDVADPIYKASGDLGAGNIRIHS